MLRATSEIAVAMIVRSLPEKPARAARSRPFCRAATMSPSRLMGTQVSSCATGGIFAFPGGQQLQTLLEIERGGDVVERQSELGHGDCHVRLDADDHRLRAAQPDRV